MSDDGGIGSTGCPVGTLRVSGWLSGLDFVLPFSNTDSALPFTDIALPVDEVCVGVKLELELPRSSSWSDLLVAVLLGFGDQIKSASRLAGKGCVSASDDFIGETVEALLPDSMAEPSEIKAGF